MTGHYCWAMANEEHTEARLLAAKGQWSVASPVMTFLDEVALEEERVMEPVSVEGGPEKLSRAALTISLATLTISQKSCTSSAVGTNPKK